MKTLFLFLTIFSISISITFAQERVLLRINQDGQQEAIPLKKWERTSDAIERTERIERLQKNYALSPSVPAQPSGITDKLKNYDSTQTASNFGFNHQDVALVWFMPEAPGIVKSIVWKNYGLTGDNGKAKIRAWKVDPRVAKLPTTAGANGSRSAMGYYIDSTDGDGNVTAFKDIATDTTFKPAIGNPDSAKVSFDPLGTEARWLPGGLLVTLDSANWQGIDLLKWGDTITFKQGELFGFTLQNFSPPGGKDARMEITAYGNTTFPFHSFKFYEAARNGNKGWHIRGDYEWQMYVVVEYISVPYPRIKLQQLYTTLQTGPRTVTTNVTDDNPGGGTHGIKSVDLYAKINSGAWIKSAMTGIEPNYTGTLPAANPKDTVTYYVIVTDVNNNSSKSKEFTYTIFQPTKPYLFMWNGRGAPGVQYAKYYMGVKDSSKEAPWYDIWNVKLYGTTEIPTLLTHYKFVCEANGDGGYADLTKFAGTWLATGTTANPKWWFFSDQDHGFISNFIDTIFTDTDPHAKYFGVKALINQDYPYILNGNKNATQPWQLDLVAKNNYMFKFIDDKMVNDTSTIWYDPTFEWGFNNWMDELTPTAGATILFKDKKFNDKVIGVQNEASDKSWYTTWLAFDYTAINFRSDTSRTKYATPDKDPKYAWLPNVGSIIPHFRTPPDAVSSTETVVPSEFSLKQNYPNPFNPTTIISYQLPKQSFVTLKVYDVLGREVATLVNEQQPAGMYQYQFLTLRYQLSSGVYFYRLQTNNFVATKKMVLQK